MIKNNPYIIPLFKRLVTGIILPTLSIVGFAQEELPPKIDSLIFELTYLEESPEKVDLLNELGEEYLEYDYKTAKEYGVIANDLSNKINYNEGIIRSNLLISNIYINFTTNYYEGLPYLTSALEKSHDIGDKHSEIKALKHFAFVNASNRLFEESIENYNKALDIAEELNDQEEVNLIHNLIGSVYAESGDKSKAIKFLEKAYLFEQNRDFELTSPFGFYMIGEYFSLSRNYDKADQYYNIALNAYNEVDGHRWESYIYSRLAILYLKRGESEKAVEGCNKGIEIAEKYGLIKEMLDNYKQLSIIYEEQGDLVEANRYLKRWTTINDSLQIERIISQNREFESSFDKVINEREIERLERETENNELRALNHELLRDIAIGAVVILVVLISLLILRMRYKSRISKKLNAQQEELAKLSIVASRIQQMVIIVGKNDTIEYVNEEYSKYTGYSIEEAVGSRISVLNGGPLTSTKTMNDIDHSIFELGEPIRVDLLQYKKNDDTFWARYHISPIENSNGELEKYIVVGSDVSELKKQEEEIKELSLVASNTDNSIIIFDKNIKATWVNDGFTELTGLKLEDVVGKKAYEFNKREDLEQSFIAELERQFRTNKPFSRESWGESLNGRKYCLSMQITPIFSVTGEVEKFISVGADITELKLLEEKYETIVEDSTDNITETNFDGYFTFVNTQTAKLTGYSKEELIGMHFSKVVREDFVETSTNFYREQIKNNQRIAYLEFPWLNKGGKEFWVGQNTKLRLDPETKKVVGFHNVARDITEKKAAEQALERTFKNTQLLSEIGKQITATLSIDEIIDKVYDNINQLMDANIFGIGVHNPEKNILEFPAIIENGQKFNDFAFDLEDRTRVGVVCFLDQREVFIGNIHQEIQEYTDSSEVAKPKEGDMTTSLIYLPLVHKDHKLGVLTVQSFAENAYSDYHLNVARNIAVYVGIALENAGLYHNMEEKVLERTKEVHAQKETIQMNLTNTKILSEIGLEVSSTFDFGEIFESVHSKVSKMLDADVFGVRMYNAESGVITNRYEIRNGEIIGEKCSKVKGIENFTTWSLLNRKGIFINNRLTEYKKYSDKEITDHSGPMSMLYYPMVVDDKLTGVITVQSWKENAYKPYHLDLLKSLSSYIGTALDNAELYETLELKVAERTEELNQINKDITSSINYAKRIQRGILPSESFMKQLLPESEVFYRPRDIVSGDFYWMERKEGKIMMAAVDCTGHGVPGALISIIGRNLLDQAVNEKGFTEPAQILNFLQIGMMVTFGQMDSENVGVYDGMDIALVTIDMDLMVLEYAGANNPLYLIRDGELIIEKGDKMGVSAQKNDGYFTNHVMELEKNDLIFLFSDGYPDQFGGERNKKFTYRRMAEMFVENSSKPMKEQFEVIAKTFDNWKGETQQTDDVCIVAARI
ncbi:MAG: PAS domain S-box protein [Crocinitomicaceae bacterium]|nr:PAS domain S-box protein [Crocinitomicaceae bacterium]